MGMTSEEPITHLEWFTDLLKQAGLRPAEHLLVMTLPGSYLDRFAHEQQAPSRPLPAALYLTSLPDTFWSRLIPGTHKGPSAPNRTPCHYMSPGP
jgi:hypothetical protein